jgi:hypothetical protein
MSNKKTPPLVNYSVKYHIGKLPEQQPPMQQEPMKGQIKPRILLISGIPDDHTVVLEYFDRIGRIFEFKVPGGFDLPPFEEFDSEEIVLGGRRGLIPQFSKPDFAINRISDPETCPNALAMAMQLVAEHKIPVLNHPEKIQETRRDRLYQRFMNYKGIVVPKTIRIAPKYCSDVRTLIESGEIRLPCIFRPATGHNSRGVFLINTLEDTNELERFAFDGRDFYVIEYHDCRDGDGLYRKLRLIYVDGKIYPRHLFVSETWCVDAKTRFAEEKYFDEEMRFLADPDSYLGEDAMSRLKNFSAEIGLDFFGLDMNLRPDGTLVLFEANASMAVFGETSREYMKQYISNIQVATKEMLLRFHQTMKART